MKDYFCPLSELRSQHIICKADTFITRVYGSRSQTTCKTHYSKFYGLALKRPARYVQTPGGCSQQINQGLPSAPRNQEHRVPSSDPSPPPHPTP